MKDEFILDNIPKMLNMEQCHKLCHISKKAARYLLRSGKVHCTYIGKRTRCYSIWKKDVIAYLQEREEHPKAYKEIPGWYSGG